jgi:tetratricopeptide (TPR) repeat protein
LELVFEAVSAYFTVLAPIVKDSSLYRQEAAKLAAECAIMKTMLGWHLEGPRGTFPAAQDAQVYARESGDVALQLRALRYSSWLYQHARLSVQALKISEQARPLLKQHALSLPSRLVGGMYSTLSVMQAKAGQGQDAVTSSRKAAVAFCTQTSADSELLTYRGDFSTASLALNDGLMYYANRDYSKALDSLQPLINLDTLHLKMPLPERNRIEAINLIALTELKSKNRDMEHITHCWTTAIKGAKQLQSEQRFTESLVAYEIMEGVWPDDARIEELRELIVHW